MTKNILPGKSGNAESLKKQSQQFESFSTNVHIIGITSTPEDLVTNSLLSYFFILFFRKLVVW